jgi:hypothetical protein
MCQVSGPGFDELMRLVTSAASEFELEMWVLGSTGDRIYDDFVARLQPKRQQVAGVLQGLNTAGTLEPFLRKVWAERPGRPDVRAAIERLCPSAAVDQDTSYASLVVQRGGVVDPLASTRAAAPGFQRNVRPSLPQLDPRQWVEALRRRERCVCRIELDGGALGTGFLVGPEAIITNYHVIERTKANGRIGALGCRFDYALREDGARDEGFVVGAAGDALIAWSPYAPAEATAHPDQPPPTANELDFAMLRLARAVGAEPAPGGTRGWIALPRVPVRMLEDAPLLILQHPDGAPVKLALDTQGVICQAAGGLRLRYRTNTDPGSSGSPCFTIGWDLVALHHLGDPAWRRPPSYNQGIPAHLIRTNIDAGPGAALLGG